MSCIEMTYYRCIPIRDWKNSCGPTKRAFQKNVRRSPFGSEGNAIESEAPVFLLYLGQWTGIWGRKERFIRLFLLLGRSARREGMFERVGLCEGGGFGKPRDRVEEYDEFEEMDFTLV